MSAEVSSTLKSLFDKVFDSTCSSPKETVKRFMRDNLPKEIELQDKNIQDLFDQAVKNALQKELEQADNDYDHIYRQHQIKKAQESPLDLAAEKLLQISQSIQNAISPPPPKPSSSIDEDFVVIEKTKREVTTLVDPEKLLNELSIDEKKMLSQIRNNILIKK